MSSDFNSPAAIDSAASHAESGISGVKVSSGFPLFLFYMAL
jgi:hypothetical protein